MRRRRIVTQRLQGTGGAVRRVPGTDRIVRAEPRPENDRQEGVLPRGEDGVSPFVGVDFSRAAAGRKWKFYDS